MSTYRPVYNLCLCMGPVYILCLHMGPVYSPCLCMGPVYNICLSMGPVFSLYLPMGPDYSLYITMTLDVDGVVPSGQPWDVSLSIHSNIDQTAVMCDANSAPRSSYLSAYLLLMDLYGCLCRLCESYNSLLRHLSMLHIKVVKTVE